MVPATHRTRYQGQGLVGCDRTALATVAYDFRIHYQHGLRPWLTGEIRVLASHTDIYLVDGALRLQLADGVHHVAVVIVAMDVTFDNIVAGFQIVAADEQNGRHNILRSPPPLPAP